MSWKIVEEFKGSEIRHARVGILYKVRTKSPPDNYISQGRHRGASIQQSA